MGPTCQAYASATIACSEVVPEDVAGQDCQTRLNVAESLGSACADAWTAWYACITVQECNALLTDPIGEGPSCPEEAAAIEANDRL